MKISYKWINDYCNACFSVKELSERLTNAGMVVAEVKQVGDDYCLEVEITSNRPDCLSLIGIAREIRAITGCELRMPEVLNSHPAPLPASLSFTPLRHEDVPTLPICTPHPAPRTSTPTSSAPNLNVSIHDNNLCPRYIAKVIEGVQIKPSPAWLQERLAAVGIRVVNNVVDATNYVLMECGQPLHAFDFDKLIGAEIVVRTAIAGELIVTIDGAKHTLSSDMLVIADQKRPIAIAGIMGGKETEVDKDTRNILLECARFESTNIRRTAKKVGITSDSSYRFERGVDPSGLLWASNRAAYLIKEIAGGNIIADVDKDYDAQEEDRISLRMRRLKRVLGVEIEKKDARDILERLGFQVVSETDERIDVKSPAYRSDVSREIDLIEEVIRIYGYDKIPVKTGIDINVVSKRKDELVRDKTCHLLNNLGLYEVITYSIVEPPPPAFDTNPWAGKEYLVIRNPIVKTEDRLRKTLLFSLLKTKRYNQDKGVKEINVFEVSKIYLPVDGEKLPDEKTCLGLLVEKGFLELKGIVEAIMGLFYIKERCRWIQDDRAFFNKGMAAKIEMDNKPLGFAGEVNSELSSVYELKGHSYLAEIDLGLLIDKAVITSAFQRLPDLPPITRDIAVVTDEGVKWADVEDCIRAAQPPFLEGIEFFDVYRGKQIEAGKKSLAFSVRFRAEDRTLTGEEADKAVQIILEALNRKLGARLRQ